MNKKTMYTLGAVVLIVVIVIIVLLMGKSNPAEQNPQTTDTNNTPVTDNSATSAVNPTSEDVLIGTWVSSEKGKGLQGSGEITLNGSVSKISLTSDVNLVIQKVASSTGTGTISFANTCLTTTVSISGKPDVTNPTQCLNTYSQAAVMQITGNTIQYTGKSILGASISLSGTFTNDSMTGTFTRTSSSGKISGTFSLVRAQN